MAGRRAFLGSLAAAGLAGAGLPGLRRPARAAQRARYLSGGAGLGGRHHVVGIDDDGALAFADGLPDRGHAVAVAPDGRTAVICARRPGRFAAVVDLADAAITGEIPAAQDRHFYGHAAFTADGSRLFATENAYALGEGRVGIYDAADGFRRVGEWPTRGVGPHEVRLMPDGRMLAVANGGILTHPDTGREKLNLDSMDPCLVLIDAGDGRLLERIALPASLRRLSARHLAIGRGGRIAVVMQYEGPDTDLPPLIALIERPGRMRFVVAPQPVHIAMANYCGSVAFDEAGAVFGVSSPRGGLFTFWSADGAFLDAVSVIDGCGIAPAGGAGRFVLSDGLGGLWRYDLAAGGLARLAAFRDPVAHWDNHLTAVPAS